VARSEDAWTAVCVLLVATVASVDAALGGGLEAVLVAGPVVASTQINPRRTAGIAALSLGVGVGVAGFNGRLGRLDVGLRLLAFVGISAVSVAAARSRCHREERLQRLARVAEVAQQAIMRPVPVRAGNILFATRYLSAAEDALVGGDLFDVVISEDRVRLIVGDVRGKGVEAVRLAALVLGLFREAAAENDLASLAKAVDSAISGYLEMEDFVTAVFVEFGGDGRLSLVNCGHHPPLRIRPDGTDSLSSNTPSLPLGLGPDFVVQTETLAPGERLLVYTDGLIEARDPVGSFFDLDRLPEGLLTRATLDATLEGLVKRLLAHVGGRLNDDLALVLAEPLHFGGGAQQL
jgi:sigma-B regulation protein RsbU (phosphoserine phosphatase)